MSSRFTGPEVACHHLIVQGDDHDDSSTRRAPRWLPLGVKPSANRRAVATMMTGSTSRIGSLRLAAQRIEGSEFTGAAGVVQWMLAMQAQDLAGAKLPAE